MPYSNYDYNDGATKSDTLLLTERATRYVNRLRVSVISLLVITASVVSLGVFFYTRNEQDKKFLSQFDDDAIKIIESFSQSIERSLLSMDALSTLITSYAMKSNSEFPFVTIPDFELHGTNFRIQSGTHAVHYMPLITDEKRAKWEEYALQNRYQIDEAYELDSSFRLHQDMELGLLDNEQEKSVAEILDKSGQHRLQQQAEITNNNETILDDGTGYHPRIWSNGAIIPRGDVPEGSGPFLPLWQRSPVNAQKQAIQNMDFSKSRAILGVIDVMEKDQKAIMHRGSVPIPQLMQSLEANLKISQYREIVDEYINDPSTFLTYPIFDTFDYNNKQLVGVLASNIYWKVLFTDLLSSQSKGIICVLSNSFNQTFAYQIDGPVATYLGMDDPHNPKYDHFAVTEDINTFLKNRAKPQNRGYATVPLNEDVGKYRITVYPSETAEDEFLNSDPYLYFVVVVVAFAFTSLVFVLYAIVVEKRQFIMMKTSVENANKATIAERELNEFLSHEVRNPLSAAMSATNFVSEAVNDPQVFRSLSNNPDDIEKQNCVREDVEVIKNSLHYINDFLRSMLDIQRVNIIDFDFDITPIDILRDVLEPVSAMIYKRAANFDIRIVCPENLYVMTDRVRLKQVVLNLVVNSSKFVERGYIQLRASVDTINGTVNLYIEDSGPGIPAEKHETLFAKFQSSLDMLSQGTGVGLCLSKKLMLAMGGDLILDTSYDSGVDDCPGTCFVIQLNKVPVDIEATMSSTVNTTNTTTLADAVVKKYPTKKPNIIVGSKGNVINKNGNYNNYTGSSSTIERGGGRVYPSEETKKDIDNTKNNTGTTVAIVDVENPTSLNSDSFSSSNNDTLPDNLSILFVDDDVVLRKLFVRAIKKAAPTWKICEASSGEIAISLCCEGEGGEVNKQKFDIIFLDQYMASVDKQLLGTETALALRMKGITSKICGLSANDMRSSFMNSGANDFILKPMPCGKDDLRETLFRILNS